jgi:hypothetical protein
MPEQKNIALLEIKVYENPRTTLKVVEAETCRLLSELRHFYKEREDNDVADIYQIGVMLHATLGLALVIKSPKMLTEIVEFLNNKSQEYIESAIEEAVDLMRELQEREN